jgi:hypothetical protein
MDYDSTISEFRTTSSVSLATSVELSSLFFSTLLEVRDQFAVIQLSPDTLSVVNPVEGTSFSIPVALKERLCLASIDDVKIISTSGSSELVLAVLGKVASHAWIGRTNTVGDSSSAVRIVSVDTSSKSHSVIWSFEGLPTESFGLVHSGYLMVISAGSVSVCPDFGSPVTKPIGDMYALSRSVCVGIHSGFFCFFLQNGSVVGCHVIGTAGKVEQIMFDTTGDIYRGTESVSLQPSCVAVSTGKIVFLGSRDGNSLIFFMQDREFSVDTVSTTIDGIPATSDPLQKLLASYNLESSSKQRLKSIELGLVDELISVGKITGLSTTNSGAIMCGTSTGSVVELSTTWPTELVFETKLKSPVTLVGQSTRIGQNTYSVLVGAGDQPFLILIETTVGFKEFARWSWEAAAGPMTAYWREDEILVVSGDGVRVISPFTGSAGVTHIPTMSGTEMIVDSAITPEGQLFVLSRSGHNEVGIAEFDEKMSEISKFSVSTDGEIRTISLSVIDTIPTVTITDTNGALFIFSNDKLIFHSKYVSLCKPILANESVDAASPDLSSANLSVTDITKRPVEVDPSIPGFAKQIPILRAELVELGGLVLVILIEGRPVMMYRTRDLSVFKLEVFDCPILVDGGMKTKTQRIDDLNENIPSVLIGVNSDYSVVLSNDVFRNELSCVPSHVTGISVSLFNSEFLPNSLIAIDSGNILRLHKKSECMRFVAMQEETVTPNMEDIVADVQSPEMPRTTLLPRVSPTGALAYVVKQNVSVATPEAVVVMDESTPETSPTPDKVVFEKYTVEVRSAASVVTARIQMEDHEMVTDLTWASSVVGLGSDVLAIATTYLLGEEVAVQGRLILVRTEGHAIGAGETGCRVIYEIPKKSSVTVVRDWKGCLAVGLDHRLMFYQWDGVAGRLRGCGMYDFALQITSLAFTKNYIAAGDIIRGVHFLRWKEDAVIDFATGAATSMAASVQFLAKSHPSQSISVTAVEVVTKDNTAGIVTLDNHSNIDLEVFAPMHYGANLRPSIPFQLPSPSSCIARTATGGTVIGTASGSVCHLVPVTEADHHLAASLTGLMVALLPHVGGVNPRLKHIQVGRTLAPGAFQAIESIDLLVHFLYLATPLQAEIATRMKQPIEALMKSVARWLRVD